MAYIDFGKPPIKESSTFKPKYSCGDCPHKITITNDIVRCDITNLFMFKNQTFNDNCEYKTDTINKRKCIFGVFTYNDSGDIIWTGIAGGAIINDSNDKIAIDNLYNNFTKGILKQFPDFNNVPIIYCLIAEAINDIDYIPKTNLIPKTIVHDIINKMNYNNQ